MADRVLDAEDVAGHRDYANRSNGSHDVIEASLADRLTDVCDSHEALRAEFTKLHDRNGALRAELAEALEGIEGVNMIRGELGRAADRLEADLAAMTAVARRLLYGWRRHRNNNGTHGWVLPSRHMVPEPMTDAEKAALDALEAATDG